MSPTKKTRPAIVADIPIKFKPFRADAAEIKRLAGAWGKSQPDVVRELISEALKARRLKQVGKDEATEAVVEAQKRAMGEMLAPLADQITGLRQITERVEHRMVDEFDHVGGRLNFVILAVRFIVAEVIVCRILLRDYVHTAYRVFVEKLGQKTSELESNFNKRLAAYRKEASQTLDALTEASVNGLHELAATSDGFAGSDGAENGGAGGNTGKTTK